MKITLVDYIGNLGGGIRYSVELISAITEINPKVVFKIISNNSAYDRYKSFLCENSNIEFKNIPPINVKKNKKNILSKIPKSTWLFNKLGFGPQWEIEVPLEIFNNTDIVYFPWIHSHRLPKNFSTPLIGTFHDAILFQFENLISAENLKEERKNVEGWLKSNATIVCTSNATINTMNKIFKTPKNRFEVIPISGEHMKSQSYIKLPKFPWQSKKYVLTAANTFPHKNHETLITAFGNWNQNIPLVLTGEGTDLLPFFRGRSLSLRRHAKKNGLEIGKTLMNLGYMSNQKYFSLLNDAWAAVMPTRSEGGGSFPVFEAMLAGIPVICSDIEVIREQISRTGGEVIWFDVNSAKDLTSKLFELQNNYSFYRRRAEEQIKFLKKRSWTTVAKQYLKLM